MLEIDTGAPACLGREAHLDLRGHRRPRVGLPFGADLPGDDQPLTGLPDTYVSDHHIAPILVARIPAATDERLDAGLLDRPGADAVALRPPAIDAGGEYGERLRRVRLDHDRLADHRDLNGAIHGFFLPCALVVAATSFLKASSASLQNPSSQRRSSPSPCRSM